MTRRPRGPLVVVGGLPGSGKSTAMARVREAVGTGAVPHGTRVLDSAEVRARLRVTLGAVPYPLVRALVHTGHWLQMLAAAWSVRGPLVVHETATRRRARAAFVLLAAVAGRPLRLVWIETDPGTARAGQVLRGRVVRGGSFARHVRRVARRHPADAARTGRGWQQVVVTGREGAAQALVGACGAGPAVGPTRH